MNHIYSSREIKNSELDSNSVLAIMTIYSLVYAGGRAKGGLKLTATANVFFTLYPNLKRELRIGIFSLFNTIRFPWDVSRHFRFKSFWAGKSYKFGLFTIN